MPVAQDAVSLIIETLVGLYLIAVVLRFLFQLFRVDFHNPISQTIVKVTNLPLRYLRRFIPGLYGIDFASIVLIVIVAFIKTFLILSVSGFQPAPLAALVLGVAEAINIVCWTVLIAIIGSAIVSWVAPNSQHPAIALMRDLSSPVMAPFRRLLPNMGGLDISPIFAILGIQLVQKIIVNSLNNVGVGLLN